MVGEYSYVLEDTDTEEVLEKITRLLMRTFEDKTTTNWVVSSVTKLVARLGSMPDNVQSQVAVYLASTDTDVQQVGNMFIDLTTGRVIVSLLCYNYKSWVCIVDLFVLPLPFYLVVHTSMLTKEHSTMLSTDP